jgi:hypothetical protein
VDLAKGAQRSFRPLPRQCTPYEHPAQAWTMHVKVELVHPALLVFQVRAVVVLIADGKPDSSCV